MGNQKQLWSPERGLVSNADLNTILETEREKIELTARSIKPKLNVKPLDLGLKKFPENGSNLGLISQPSDRSRVGLLLSSTRSGLYLASENYFNNEQTSPALSNRWNKRSDKYEESISSPLSILRNTSNKVEGEAEAEADDGGQTAREIKKIFEDDEPPKTTKRRANSLVIIPEAAHFDAEEVTENPEVKEGSKMDLSELVTNPAGEVSAVQNCLICFDNGPDAVFMECGHGGKNQ